MGRYYVKDDNNVAGSVKHGGYQIGSQEQLCLSEQFARQCEKEVVRS